jgi:hypothetical protein
MRQPTLAVLLTAALISTVSAQDPAPVQQQPPIFRAGVDVVQLELSILDEDFQLVHGLAKTDLQVFEDGKNQDIVDLREIMLDDGTPPPVWARAVSPDVATNDLADRRLIAIVMDDLNCCGLAGSTMTDRVAVSNAIGAANYLAGNLGPHDLATVALTHEMMAAQPFTSDRDALRATIARFTPVTDTGCQPRPPVPNLANDLSQLLAMSPQPIKAVVVLTSMSGGGRGLLPCAARSYTVPDTGQRVTVTVPPDSGPQPDPLGLPPVPVYRLDVSGRFVMPTFGGGRSTSQLRRRKSTGDDVPDTLDEILRQNDSYYLLGFHTSRPTTDGQYRRLEIKVPGHRNYTVRARAGYMRPKPPPKPGSRAYWNPEVPRPPVTVSNVLPSSDITLETAVAAFAVPGSRNNALIISIDLAHAVTESTASESEELDLRTVVYQSGDPKYDLHSKAKIDVLPGIRRVSTSIPSRLDLAPDRYELWLTARDGRTNRVGSVFYDIDIPDRTTHAITLSGVVLGSEPVAGAPLPAALAGIVPIVPTTSRLFGQGQSIAAYFQMYQGRATPLAPVSLAIRVLDDQGAAKLATDETIGAERFASNRAADYRLRLPLETLTSGRYLLTIEARIDERISPKRDVMFSVR